MNPDTRPPLKVLWSLHWRLVAGSISRNKATLILSLVTLFYAGTFTVGLGFGLLLGAETQVFWPFVFSLAFGTIIYWFGAAMWPSPFGALLPADLAVFPLSSAQVRRGITFLAWFSDRAGIAVVNTGVMALFGGLCVWNGTLTGASFAWWLLALGLALILTVYGGEVIANLGVYSGGRSKRERMAMIGSMGFLAFIVIINLVANYSANRNIDGWLERMAVFSNIIGWTPFGLGVFVSAGLVQKIIVLIEVLALLLIGRLVLGHAVTKQLVTVTESGTIGEVKHRNGQIPGDVLLPGFPSAGWAVVASRNLLYLRRDVRQLYGIIAIPVIGFMFGFTQPNSLFGLAMLALSGGSLMANTLGIDGPANWVNLSAGVRAKDVLLGRMLPVLVLVSGLILLYSGLITWLNPGDYPGLSGFLTLLLHGLCGMAGTAGLAALFSVLWAYPMAAPGTNPMKDKSGASGTAFLVGIANMLLILPLMLPGAMLTLSGIKNQQPVALYGGFALSAVLCGLVLVISFWVACRRLENTWPEVFQKVNSWA